MVDFPGRDEDEDQDLDESGDGTGGDHIEKLNELLERAEPLILSVNSSFNQWSQGIEIRPPTERLHQLDAIMMSLMMMAKPTPAYRFRFQNIQATYHTYKKRWEKLVKDIESGKIKRPNRRAS